MGPKAVYLANRMPALSMDQFAKRWRQHGALAMSLPIWENMARYSQCDPVALGGEVPEYDGVGLVWYRSANALNSIGERPWLREPLLEDELKTFSGYIRDCAVLMEEEVLQEGDAVNRKLFVFSKDPVPDGVYSGHTGRIVIDRAVANAYTAMSRLPYRMAVELDFQSIEEMEAHAGAIRGLLSANDLVIGTQERRLFGHSIA